MCQSFFLTFPFFYFLGKFKTIKAYLVQSGPKGLFNNWGHLKIVHLAKIDKVKWDILVDFQTMQNAI